MSAPVILIIEDDDFQYEIYEEALAKVTFENARSVLRRTEAWLQGKTHPLD